MHSQTSDSQARDHSIINRQLDSMEDVEVRETRMKKRGRWGWVATKRDKNDGNQVETKKYLYRCTIWMVLEFIDRIEHKR